MLLGGDAGQGLELVSVVSCAMFHRPVFQRARNRVGGREIERLSARNRGPERPVDRLRQAGLLHLVVKHELAELLGGL